MDLDANYSWKSLCDMTANRSFCRQRINALHDGEIICTESLSPTTTDHRYHTRSKYITTSGATAPQTTTSNTNSKTRHHSNSSATTAATRYRKRDAHDQFFSPNDGTKRQCCRAQPPRKRQKKRGLTDKQRAVTARDDYFRNYDPKPSTPTPKLDPPPTTPSTPVDWTPPSILGHHQHYKYNPEDTVSPIEFHAFLDNSSDADRKALQRFSRLYSDPE